MPKGDGNRGKGKGYAFLVEHLNYDGEECLKWPFSTDNRPGRLGGRGYVGYNGEDYFAHRLMCEMVHGAPPTPNHKAAHSCGNGHLGCVHPKHLDWKTQKENIADAKAHGTLVGHHYGPRGKLTPEQVTYIRESEGVITQRALAAELGCSEGIINDIWRGRKWRADKKQNLWSAADDAKLLDMKRRKFKHHEIATAVGRSAGAVMARLTRVTVPTRLREGT
jgi:hypothetical protein